MLDPIKTKNFVAESVMPAYRLARMGTVKNKIRVAVDSQSPFVGLSDNLGAENIGDRIDVYTHGFAEVELGGAVAAGDALTADSVGRAVKAEYAADQVVHIAGYAMDSGVLGDVVGMRINPCAYANESQIAVVEKELTTAEVLALNATPIEVVAAPGAGKAVIVVQAEAMLDYATTAYDGVAAGEDLALRYTDGTGTILAQFETTGFLDQATDQVRVAGPQVPVADSNLTPVANAPVVAHMTTAEIATGDSPVKLRVRYRVVDTAW